MKRAEIRLWDIETGERIRDLAGPDEIGFGAVALSPDGRKMAIVNFQRLRMLDASTLESAVGRPPCPAIGRADSRSRPMGSSSRWRSRTPSRSSTQRRGGGCTTTTARPSAASGRRLGRRTGDRIVTGHSDGFVRVWDAATGKLIWHKLLAPIVRLGGQAPIPPPSASHATASCLLAAGRRDDPSDSGQEIVVVYEAATGEVDARIPSGLVPARRDGT